jgi:hypothetical protein
LYRSFKNSQPTTAGALVEVLLVLAIGFGVVGIYRGWFMDSAGNRIRPTSNDSVQSTAPIAAAKVDSEVAR